MIDEDIILAVLAQSVAEMQGKDIVFASEGKLKLSTIFITLRQMEDAGIIESRREAVEGSKLSHRLYWLANGAGVVASHG